MAFFNNTKIKVTSKIPIPSEPGYVPPTPPSAPTPSDSQQNGINRPILTENSTITLYTITDEIDKIVKTLGTGLSMSGGFIEDTNVLHPVVEIESALNLTTYNYAQINTTGRYYFLKVVMLPNKRYRLIMDVDPFMSWSNGIKNAIGYVTHCEDSRYFNKYINDGSFVNQEGIAMSTTVYDNPPPISTQFYGYPFNDLYKDQQPHNILITCGGSTSNESEVN